MSKIVVGISGGVDSSVAAYLLQKEGHEVIGCRMRTFDTEASRREEDASREVCETLGIPLFTVDFRERFREEVIALFASEYAKGRTPNPCCICNRTVKWEALLSCMREQKADFVATGHYARTGTAVSPETGEERFFVARADSVKDQSYALYNLRQDEIRHTLFPLSRYKKEEIREIARKAGLLTADKPDSMEICFIPDNDYAAFLREQFGIADCPGNYVDEEGKVLGRHQGIVHYTVGQRKGLGIALGKRIFVKEIRPLTNEVVLADDEDVFTDHLFLGNVNFQAVSGIPETPAGLFSPLIKIRYADQGAPGRMTAVANPSVGKEPVSAGYRIDFERPVRAASPGQAAVLYGDDGRILCGGTIRKN